MPWGRGQKDEGAQSCLPGPGLKLARAEVHGWGKGHRVTSHPTCPPQPLGQEGSSVKADVVGVEHFQSTKGAERKEVSEEARPALLQLGQIALKGRCREWIE